MLVELLTPLVLATAPVRIDLAQGAYDHQSQAMAFRNEGERLSWTVNASRTFDALGNPNDADHG